MTQEEFEELTPEQNQIIQEARELGYIDYYSPYPDKKAQAINTLGGAIKFLKEIFSDEEKKFSRNIERISK